jgi:hypothetical protein
MSEYNLPVPDDMPWLNLSQEEVNELRNKKFELTQYGKQRLKELIYKEDMRKMEDAAKDLVLNNLTHEEMTTGELIDTEKFQEELSKQKVFDADKFVDEERKQRSDVVLSRYNHFYNDEVSGLPHGTPITMEQLQCIALSCAIDALICENMNMEYDVIAIDDIKDLIEGLYRQSNEFLERVRTVQEQAQGHSKTDLDAL